jgi:hypothetical protein
VPLSEFFGVAKRDLIFQNFGNHAAIAELIAVLRFYLHS